VIGVEASLATALLSTLLRRPIPLVAPDATLDPTLSGALTALVIEAARASGASVPLRPAAAEVVGETAAVHLGVTLAGRPYAAVLFVPVLASVAPRVYADALLARLCDVSLALPLVVGECLATPRGLATLGLGAALCPGAGMWIDRNGAGRGCLASGTSERGVPVALETDGRIVLRQASTVALSTAEAASMPSDDPFDPPTLADAVLDAPLVVRIELGSVSMKAREWADLRPGDVIASGQRVAEPVLLRAAGRALAEGELVNLEGELGVRIVRLLADERD
jgi:flagellar motor switch/type III secretory pathway protein FliN